MQQCKDRITKLLPRHSRPSTFHLSEPLQLHHYHLLTSYSMIQSNQIVHHSPDILGSFTVLFFAYNFPSAHTSWKNYLHSTKPNSNGCFSVKPLPVCPHETLVTLPHGSHKLILSNRRKLLLFIASSLSQTS